MIQKLYQSQEKCQFNVKNTLISVMDTQFIHLDLKNLTLSFEKQFPSNLRGRVKIFEYFMFLINDMIFRNSSTQILKKRESTGAISNMISNINGNNKVN